MEYAPRWEWRTFGTDLGPAMERLSAFGAGTVRQSAEIYLLSARAEDNAKIRGGLLDVKALQQVGDDGLEQWKPILKASFPAQAAAISRVFATLRVEPPAYRRDAFTLDEFLTELVAPCPHLRVVQVRKARTGYTINACIAETAEVVADGRPIGTIAVESEDAARVLATVRDLGLAGFAIINYVRGLKRLVGMTG